MSEDALQTLGLALGDSTRCELLTLMMDGRALPAGELAALTHVSGATATHHLKILLDCGLVSVLQQGRHRYYRLSSDEVAGALEAFGTLSVPKVINKENPLRYARCCYNHLAGQVAIELRCDLVSRRWIRAAEEKYYLTQAGLAGLDEMGFAQPSTKQQAGKVCLDWTERVPHIGGPLGAYLLDQFLSLGWLSRTETPRLLYVRPTFDELISSYTIPPLSI